MSSQSDNSSPRPQRTELEATTARFGMGVFLVPFSILFAATMVLYVIVWLRLPEDAVTPGWPLWQLLISTVILLGVSICLSRALKAVSKAQLNARTLVLTALILGFIFLFSQLNVWLAMKPAWNPDAPNHYLYVFLLLTFLHAAHVVGGLIPLVTVTKATWRGYYTPTHMVGLASITTYWHFLDAVWLIMLAVFLVTG